MKEWIWKGMCFKYRAASKPTNTLYRVESFKIIEGAMPPTAWVRAAAIRKDGQLRVNRYGFVGNLFKGSFLVQEAP